MRRYVLAADLVLMATAAQASSYLDILGTVHDPILTPGGAVHSYSGPNLQPKVVAPGVDLSSSDLESSNFGSAFLDFADLSSANLSYASGLWTTFGSPDYDALTDFTSTGFDPVAPGWNLVPEPSTALLVGLGLVGMAARRRSLG